jgi:hypothetical protein
MAREWQLGDEIRHLLINDTVLHLKCHRLALLYPKAGSSCHLQASRGAKIVSICTQGQWQKKTLVSQPVILLRCSNGSQKRRDI